MILNKRKNSLFLPYTPICTYLAVSAVSMAVSTGLAVSGRHYKINLKIFLK